MIELKQITKTYQLANKPFYALKNINLAIARGEIFGIFGESGAGKSTLLRTLNLLERPTQGEVMVNQTNLMTLLPHGLKKARQQIGMIFQQFNLLSSRTAFENIALPLELLNQPKNKIKEEVAFLLSLTRLLPYQHHFPEQLSGGQQQRVAIARALATKPQILLCDEPTSALDTRSTLSILTLLKDINRQLGVTIVIITHEMDVIKQICSRAGVLHHGELIEQGSVIDLFSQPKAEITKQLVQKALHLELPSLIKEKLKAEPHEKSACLVRFTFVGEDSNQPLITTLVKQFNITISIVQANIENIQEATVGFTICLMSGEQDAIHRALAYVKPSSITAEILGYV